MRRVKIVESVGETYRYAAVDQVTGETALRLADQDMLFALVRRLGWTLGDEEAAIREAGRVRGAGLGRDAPPPEAQGVTA